MHQEMRGLGKRSGWHRFWLARRSGTHDWAEATTPREAIRRAALLPAKKAPAWLDAAVADAEEQLAGASTSVGNADAEASVNPD